MKGFQSSRAIIAGTQRITATSVRNLISHCQPGEGIFHQTTTGDYSEQVVEVNDEERGLTYYLVESEKFTGRYYLLRQFPNGAWRFSGDDKLKEKYIAKVEAMVQATQAAETAEEVAPETPVPAVSPAAVHMNHEELAERRARKLAAMKKEAFEHACSQVRAIECRSRVQQGVA